MCLLKERLFKLRNEPRALQRFVLRRYLFNILEWMGVHVVADHFYEPIPNLKWVNEHSDICAQNLAKLDSANYRYDAEVRPGPTYGPRDFVPARYIETLKEVE